MSNSIVDLDIAKNLFINLPCIPMENNEKET